MTTFLIRARIEAGSKVQQQEDIMAGWKWIAIMRPGQIGSIMAVPTYMTVTVKRSQGEIVGEYDRMGNAVTALISKGCNPSHIDCPT